MRFLGVIGAIALGWLVGCGGGHSSPPSSTLPATPTVLFPAGDTSHGVQLWTSDGTPQGTRILKQINGQGWAFPNSIPTTFTLFNGSYYFPAQDPDHGYELWRSDGTPSGTVLVFDAMPGPEQGIRHAVDQPFAGAGGLFFNASWQFPFTSYLWRVDESSGATGRFLEGHQGDWSGSAKGLANWGRETVFLGWNEPPLPQGSSEGIWRTDGTWAGTRLVSAGLRTYSGVSIHSGKAFFAGYAQTSDPAHFGLWGCDLESGSLQLLVPMQGYVAPHWDELVSPRFNGGFALVETQEAWNPDRFGLWRTDGTSGGSFRLRDLGSATGLVAQAREFQGKTYFPADDGIHGVELWVTDGTMDGTRMLKDLVPGAGSSHPGLSMATILPTGGFVVFKERLYFGAGGPEWSDHVLWISDGTPEGTKPLINLPGTDSRVPKLPAAFCVVGDTLYFSAQTNGNAPYTRQLWRTNGTQEGTQRVTSFDFGQNWNPIWSIQASPRP